MSQTISLRLPDNIIKDLNKLCEELDRSKTYIIKKAVEKYLEDYIDYDIALERLNNKGDKVISSKELRNKLGI